MCCGVRQGERWPVLVGSKSEVGEDVVVGGQVAGGVALADHARPLTMAFSGWITQLRALARNTAPWCW